MSLFFFFLIAASAARAAVGGSWPEQRLIGSFTSPLAHQLVDSLILWTLQGFKSPSARLRLGDNTLQTLDSVQGTWTFSIWWPRWDPPP